MSEELIHGHAAFRAGFFEEREFMKRLAVQGQKPKALYIGCSDSRVVPEYLTSAGVGDLFVVRNIANHVPAPPHSDLSVGAAIEYAVAQLAVPDIIVCGHYGCGGVKAALDGLDQLKGHAELTAWLTDLGPTVTRVRSSGLTGDALWRAAVEEHVLQSIDAVIAFPMVHERLQAGTIHVHGWVYDLYSTKLMVFDAASDRWADALELR
jgi:carbonic anhydrase